MAIRCSTALRAISRPLPRHTRLPCSSRCLTTAATATSSSTSPPPVAPSDPKIGRIVDDISGLTLLQAADLVTLLKSRLNIQEVAVPTAAAPVAAAAPPEAEAEVEKPKEQTIFNVMLDSFEAGAKPKIIREVKALVPNLTLIDAKKFVESLPKLLKENQSKEDAETMKAKFEALGAVIKFE